MEEITGHFYFILAIPVISALGAHGQMILATKSGKPLEERLEDLFSAFFKRAITAGEHLALFKHPEALHDNSQTIKYLIFTGFINTYKYLLINRIN